MKARRVHGKRDSTEESYLDSSRTISSCVVYSDAKSASMSRHRRLHTFLSIMVCLTVFRQGHLIDGFGRLMAFGILVFLLLFVVARSADICRTVAASLRVITLFFAAIVLTPESFWQPITDICDLEKPLLPFRFQRPPPPVAA